MEYSQWEEEWCFFIKFLIKFIALLSLLLQDKSISDGPDLFCRGRRIAHES